jgi:protein-disulfide isomerase
MAELNLAGDIEHIRDVKEIGKYGVMGTPALIINGKVKSVGKVPPKSKLMEWLKGV